MSKQFKPWVFPDNAIHVSVDLETASTANDAAIVQIGACCYVNGTTHKFNTYVSLASCEAAGLDVSKETMEWWSQKDPELRKRVFSGTETIANAIDMFIDWCNLVSPDSSNQIVLWGNGCNFDNVILKSATEKHRSWPFHYRNDHHLRTMMALVPAEVQSRWHGLITSSTKLTAHDALDDAIYQHGFIMKALKYHGID